MKALTRNWDPLRHLKHKLARPYSKLKDGFRFLTIYSRYDNKIYHDLICVLSGKNPVGELHTHGNEARFRGLRFSFPERGTQLGEIINEVFVHRIYEGFGATISKGDVVLDCGANIGLFTLYAQQRIGSTGKIISIEPIIETYRLLTRNALENARPHQFIPLNLALSDKVETRAFVYSEERNGSATGCVKRFEIAKGSTDSYKTLLVPCTSIDEIALNDLKTRIDFIKMDVEGMEKEVIRGATKTIRLFKPKLAISSHFDPKEIVKSLKQINADYKITSSNDIIYAW